MLWLGPCEAAWGCLKIQCSLVHLQESKIKSLSHPRMCPLGEFYLLVEFAVQGATEMHEFYEVGGLALLKGMMLLSWSGLAPFFSSLVMICSMCPTSFL